MHVCSDSTHALSLIKHTTGIYVSSIMNPARTIPIGNMTPTKSLMFISGMTPCISVKSLWNKAMYVNIYTFSI